MTYAQTIETLFALLDQANRADHEDRETWQRPRDAAQCGGHYGFLSAAIVAIAGPAIVEHWAECGEVKLSLANRRA